MQMSTCAGPAPFRSAARAARDPHLNPPPFRGRKVRAACSAPKTCSAPAARASLPLQGGEIEWGLPNSTHAKRSRNRSRDALGARVMSKGQIASGEWRVEETLFAFRYSLIRHSRSPCLAIRYDKGKKEAERRQTCSANLRIYAMRRAPLSLFPPPLAGEGWEGARSPIGVPPRLLPSGLSALEHISRPGFLGRDESVRSCTVAPTGEQRSCALTRAYPRPPVPVQGMHLPDRS